MTRCSTCTTGKRGRREVQLRVPEPYTCPRCLRALLVVLLALYPRPAIAPGLRVVDHRGIGLVVLEVGLAPLGHYLGQHTCARVGPAHTTRGRRRWTQVRSFWRRYVPAPAFERGAPVETEPRTRAAHRPHSYRTPADDGRQLHLFAALGAEGASA